LGRTGKVVGELSLVKAKCASVHCGVSHGTNVVAKKSLLKTAMSKDPAHQGVVDATNTIQKHIDRPRQFFSLETGTPLNT